MNLNKEHNFVSAIIYVRNNADTIKGMLEHVKTNLEKLVEQYEIICVNDASTDESEDVIKAFAKEYDQAISIVNMGYTQGVELSMNAGEDLAIGDFVFEFDRALVSWNEDMMEKIYKKMQEGYDIVSACPTSGIKTSSKIFYFSLAISEFLQYFFLFLRKFGIVGVAKPQ